MLKAEIEQVYQIAALVAKREIKEALAALPKPEPIIKEVVVEKIVEKIVEVEKEPAKVEEAKPTIKKKH